MSMPAQRILLAIALLLFGLVTAYEAARYGVPDAAALTRLQQALAEFRKANRRAGKAGASPS